MFIPFYRQRTRYRIRQRLLRSQVLRRQHGPVHVPRRSAKEDPVPYAQLDNQQSLNLYAYVRNNPMTNRDFDGHWCIAGHGSTCPPPPPNANHNHTLTVRYVIRQQGNPAGHVTVRVDWYQDVGFGPKQAMTKKEIAENKSVPGKIEPRATDSKSSDSISIHLTADLACLLRRL